MKKPPFYANIYYRLLSSLFGLFLLTLAVLVLSEADEHKLWYWVGALVFSALGSNMLWSAIKGKESWVSKIGPLP